MFSRRSALAAMFLAAAPVAARSIQINEIVVNPPGTDQGREYVELKATIPVAIPAGTCLLMLDGDGTAGGLIDQVWNISSLSFGSNGLLLRRDTADVLNPAPAAGTNVVVQDFTPDLENGSATWLLVTGFTGNVGLDLDTNNDGVIDSPGTVPWLSILDGIGYFEESLPDQSDELTYADDFGFPSFGNPMGPTPPTPEDSFTPDIIFRLTDGSWIGADLLDPDTSDPTNPLVYADVEIRDIDNNTVDLSEFDVVTWTPGSVNPTRTIAAPNTWNVDSNGDWSTAGNWSASTVPDGSTARARLGSVITAPRTITLSSPITLNELSFDNVNAYTIAGGNALSFAGTSTTIIDVARGSHTISAPVNINKTGAISVAADSGLTLSGTLSFASGVALSKTGAGTLAARNLRVDSLNIDGGKVSILADGTAGGASRVTSLSQSAGTTLDLTNNGLAIDYTGASPAGAIRAAIISGRAGGTWTGPGITSSNAAASSSDSALGYAELSALGAAPGLFGEVTTDADTVLVRYTLLGDSNLSGNVNIADFSLLAANFNSGGEWYDGDYNYDNTVNIGDFSLLAANFNRALPADGPRGAVPEPATATLLLAAALAGHRRRRS